MHRQDRVVMKFGGKCLANFDLVMAVADYLKEYLNKKPGIKIIVVVSAMGETTDGILNQIKEVAPNTFRNMPGMCIREIDQLSAIGENISAGYLTLRLNEMGIAARSMNAFQLGIETSGPFQSALIRNLDRKSVV